MQPLTIVPITIRASLCELIHSEYYKFWPTNNTAWLVCAMVWDDFSYALLGRSSGVLCAPHTKDDDTHVAVLNNSESESAGTGPGMIWSMVSRLQIAASIKQGPFAWVSL